MKHPHAELLKAYAEDTSVEIEGLGPDKCSEWIKVTMQTVLSPNYSHYTFRLKPAMRSITLQDDTVVKFPEPMRVAPAEDTEYWIAYPSGTSSGSWTSHNIDLGLLAAGFCHLTEEAAQQHRRAIVLANGGEL